MVHIIDYGMGNLGSIKNMLKRIGFDSKITSDTDEIANAKKLLLPGVGAFDAAMKRINESGIREVLDKKVVQEGTPILGICLGMQLLTNGSEEGKLRGLGWIPGKAIKFRQNTEGDKIRIPHMGWNLVKEVNANPLIESLPNESRFYFVHSFMVHVENEEDRIMQTNYGVDFDSVIAKNNVYGAQFHPEKSHKFGMNLLKNFMELC